MLLHISTWQEIDAFLKTSKAVLIPIGSTEQHGPNGLLGTDFLCPELIAHEAQKHAEILITPPFVVGMAQHHLGFAGTISLRPSTMIQVIVDWVNSLTKHGFERIYFLNGHGGNVATINAAFSEIYASASFASRPVNFALKQRNWWELPGVQSLSEQQFPVGLGSHATAAEVAVTQAGYGVKQAAYEPKIAPTGPIYDAIDFRRRYPDGRMGSDPAQATPEKGRALIELAAAELVKDFAAFAR
ncbi:creatininase family protein [Roseiterribacter gracilis]|uniref:Amidase n=1 Tax=Roseiterribacter gracilis TaxID=2812848 RepID=A0A8S8XJI9_9PROT|nr:amidase [Rhodospirillales bacterium TMPK1]